MSDVGVITLLYLAGLAILAAELFIPSHGLLSVAAVGCFAAAVIKVFSLGSTEGVVALVMTLVLVPTIVYFGIRVWLRTPMGRAAIPPNVPHDLKDTSVPVEELTMLLGQTGRSVSPLRPVGICDFGGQRVSCVSTIGVIESGTVVEGVEVRSGTLAVIEKKT